MNENYSELINALTRAINNYNNVSFNWSEFIISLLPSILVIISMIVSVRITKINSKSSSNVREKEKLELQLQSFYFPFLTLLQKNKVLYEIFTTGKDDEFRTLIELLKGTTFPGNDGEILKEIVENDNKLNELIFRESKFIDDDELRKILIKASSHFTIINLAYHKNLRGDLQRFSEYIYPRVLEDKVVNQIKKTKAKIAKLS